MKAVLYSQPRVFTVEDIGATDPGPTDVQIRVQTGLCGTDKHIHEGDFTAHFPLVPRHEIVGTVEAAGGEATGSACVGARCVGLTRDRGTVMVYGVTHPEDMFAVHPYDIFRREITIKGSFAEIASFPAAVAALRSGRVRTEGPIAHRYRLDGYGRALDDFSNDTSLHKAVVSPLV